MKKVYALWVMVAIPFVLSAQTEKGGWLIEANTGTATTGNTSFSLSSSDGNTDWSIGADAGYFVMDNLAVKAGLGYSDAGDFADGVLVYKIGGKYYINGQIPVGLDFTGFSSDRNDGSWVGAQGGYAIFLGESVAIEPAVRYNFTLDESQAESIFQALVGFTLFL